jgi:plastocyanin
MDSLLRIRWVLAMAAASALALACGEGGGNDGVTDPGGTETAAIRAQVTQDGSGVSGVMVRLYAAGGTSAQSSQTTGTDGSATFSSLSSGTYDVEVEVPAGSELAEGAARRAVTAQAGSTATVTFALTSAVDGEIVEVLATGGLTFSPSDLTIERGTTVRWRNQAAMLHTITPDGHSEWLEGSVTAAGDIFTHTFNTAGTFPYFCAPHVAQGMTGVVTVQ